MGPSFNCWKRTYDKSDVSFLTKLAQSSRARDSIVCIGLDPEPDLIPEVLGSGPQAALRFLRRVIRATSEYACAYKPNLAFYERYGSAAFDVLALTLQAIPDDIPVVLDAKRGDVPNTSAAYADALFDSFRADAVTVAPYLGMDSIEPFCRDGRYALVLARTSNPGARDLQDLIVDGRPLYERVVERSVASFPAEACGFVVGATYPDEARRVRELAPDRLFLMPGVGSQGGDVGSAIRAALDSRGGGVLPSASRSITYASSGADFEAAAATAARALRDAANAARATAAERR
jgi:orotidine-5'-phosphate decarboxylase